MHECFLNEMSFQKLFQSLNWLLKAAKKMRELFTADNYFPHKII